MNLPWNFEISGFTHLHLLQALKDTIITTDMNEKAYILHTVKTSSSAALHTHVSERAFEVAPRRSVASSYWAVWQLGVKLLNLLLWFAWNSFLIQQHNEPCLNFVRELPTQVIQLQLHNETKRRTSKRHTWFLHNFNHRRGHDNNWLRHTNDLSKSP